MSNFAYLSGKAGELLCGGEFLRPVARSRYLFDVCFLGGDAPTSDYIVYLVDEHGVRTGPLFFAQVKTTARAPTEGSGYKVGFSAADVRRAQATKVPFFVCVVDRSTVGSAKFFIKGVESTRTRGIARLAPVHDLSMDAVKLVLYDEVTRVWRSQTVPTLMKLI